MVNDSVHHNCSLNMISNYTAMSRAPVFIPIMLFQRNFSMFPSPRYEFSASVSLPTVENWLDQPLFSLWNPENVNLYIILLLFITHISSPRKEVPPALKKKKKKEFWSMWISWTIKLFVAIMKPGHVVLLAGYMQPSHLVRAGGVTVEVLKIACCMMLTLSDKEK